MLEHSIPKALGFEPVGRTKGITLSCSRGEKMRMEIKRDSATLVREQHIKWCALSAYGRGLMLRIVLIVLLLLLLVGSLPTWGYSSGWGYYPSGGLGLLLVVVIILALMNRGGRTL
jgi:hypothetical protein